MRAHALERGERFFDRHGAKTVFLGRFVPGVRVVAAVLAGAGAMPWPRFALYNLAGAFVWAATVASLASLVGPAVAAGAVGRRARRGRRSPRWWRCVRSRRGTSGAPSRAQPARTGAQLMLLLDRAATAPRPASAAARTASAG